MIRQINKRLLWQLVELECTAASSALVQHISHSAAQQAGGGPCVLAAACFIPVHPSTCSCSDFAVQANLFSPLGGAKVPSNRCSSLHATGMHILQHAEVPWCVLHSHSTRKQIAYVALRIYRLINSGAKIAASSSACSNLSSSAGRCPQLALTVSKQQHQQQLGSSQPAACAWLQPVRLPHAGWPHA
jgi:hypothetical protein